MSEDRARHYAQWLSENKDKQGSPLYEQAAAAYRAARSEMEAAPSASAAPAQAAQPIAKTPSLLDRNIEFAQGARIGAGKALSDLGQGARQLAMGVGNSSIMPVNALLSAMGRGPVVSNESYDKMMGELQQKAQTDKGLENVPGSTTGQLAGNLALGLALPLRGPQAAAMAAKAPISTAMGTGAAYGMGFGALTPQTEQSQFEAGGKGAAIGAAVPLALGGAGQLATKAPFLKLSPQRAAETVQAAASPNRAAIEQLLRNPPKALPGEQLTAGAATTGARVPEFAALQQMAEKRMPTPYRAIDDAGEQARMAAIGTFASDKSGLSKALADRATVSGPLYDRMKKEVIPVNQELQSILNTPSGQLAMEKAKTLAENRREQFGLNMDKQGVPQQATGQALQDIKISLDELATDPLLRAQMAIGSAEGRAIGDLSGSLVRNLNERLPGFDAARSAYASASAPINQMNIGQFLQGKMTTPLSDAGAVLPQRAAIYANALRDDAGNAVRKAMDRPLPGNIQDYLTPQNLQIAQDVNRSYGRGIEQEGLAREGASALAKILGRESGQIGAPTFLSAPLTATKSAVNYLSGKASDKALDEIARKLQTPGGALELLLRKNHSGIDQYLNNFIATQAPSAAYRSQ